MITLTIVGIYLASVIIQWNIVHSAHSKGGEAEHESINLSHIFFTLCPMINSIVVIWNLFIIMCFDLTKYNKWIYSVETQTIKHIRTHQLDSSEYIVDINKCNDDIESLIKDEININDVLSFTCGDESLYLKSEITVSLIKNLIKENYLKREERRNRIENHYIRCYFTGKRLIQQLDNCRIMDGPTTYIVEGTNVIIYDKIIKFHFKSL